MSLQVEWSGEVKTYILETKKYTRTLSETNVSEVEKNFQLLLPRLFARFSIIRINDHSNESLLHYAC